MSNIALVHPASPNPAKQHLIWPPIGLCKLALYLEQLGHRVWVVEDGLNRFSKIDFLERVKNADVVGIGALTVQACRAMELAGWVREAYPAIRLVAGGPHFTAIRSTESVFDAVVCGYGEHGMDEFLNGGVGCIDSKVPADFVPLTYKYIDYDKYGDHLIDGSRAISVMTAVGCPNNCKFCGSPYLFGRHVTNYPLEAVVRNIRELVGLYGIRKIRIMDDTFTLSTKRMRLFSEQIRGDNLTMSCLTRVDALDEERILILKEMGVRYVAMGIESSDEGVLALSNKEIDFKLLEELVRIGVSHGMMFECLFMMGLPGETLATLNNSLQYAERLLDMGVYRVHFQYFTPFPGSAFHEDIVQNGMYGKLLSSDWAMYNHRMPVFVPDGMKLEELLMAGEMAIALDKKRIAEHK